MIKKFIIFCAFMILGGIAYAPPLMKVEVRVYSIGETVLLEKPNKDIEIHVDEEEQISFKVKGIINNVREIAAMTRSIPSGSSYDVLSGVFTWTPTEDQSGQYNLIFTSRTYTSLDTQKIIILVSDNIVKMKVGEIWEQHFKAIDPDGDMVRIVVIRPPRGILFQRRRANERYLRWVPTISQVGIHNFSIIAIDFPRDENGNFIRIIQKQDIRYMRIIVSCSEK